MPRRSDLKSILIIGAGPIVIGQACEFDYSGAQACKALREEGYRVILVNSNPATIMTDPATADVVYIEPVDWRVVEKIIAREKPDAILPTMGGQTGLNCALDLFHEGVLDKYGVELIGASPEAIDLAEDRDKFRNAMTEIGLATPEARIAHSLEEAYAGLEDIGFPTIIRPSFTMGGSGGGIAYNRDEFTEICKRGLDLSRTTEILLEESVLGWKEFEMEVVRDSSDNCIIVCSIENIDPMGVHTGDSITVAPAHTLTDKELQIMRNASIDVLRKIGVDTGGSNVQFAVNPENGRLIVIEMNPRVSRSSALASKATGFPIARVAAKLAVGYTLDELSNDITGGATPASFEPSIDYVVTKIPRFTFEKFPSADPLLTTQMKSVGEVMAIGRNQQESLQKALRGLETGVCGFDEILAATDADEIRAELEMQLTQPGDKRIWYVADAFRQGYSLEEVHQLCKIDPWFLAQIEDLINSENELHDKTLEQLTASDLRRLKRQGFSDKRLAKIIGVTETAVREQRHNLEIRPVYKRVDTCAAEFEANTAYMYSTYDEECEAAPNNKEKIVILGGGPNRIGQGIEFDYCCVHAALSLRDAGYETIMINCNPETVSTDYDMSDRLYFEPLTLEDVMEVLHKENPGGVIVQYGGQTPLNLANQLKACGAPIIGTSPEAIDHAEDREHFKQLVDKVGVKQPPNKTATNLTEAIESAEQIGFPLVVRPSYVLGGRAMEIVFSTEELQRYMGQNNTVSVDAPLLLDRFLDNATEVDIDAISDGKDVFIGGIMEHIEQAGVHSGDSSCALPPYSLSPKIQAELESQMKSLVLELGVIGLCNAQFAIQGDDIYIIEVNPRASRTVPFVSKATGVPLARIAARCMVGKSLAEQGCDKSVRSKYYAVKESVFPFLKFQGVDPLLGPEMKSTGEVMGSGYNFAEAFAKSSLAAGMQLPVSGCAFFSVRDADKPRVVEIARTIHEAGFSLIATEGTQSKIAEAGIPCTAVNKVKQGRPHIVDMIKNNEISLIINTTDGPRTIADSFLIRREALNQKVAYATTLAAGAAITAALKEDAVKNIFSLREIHEEIA